MMFRVKAGKHKDGLTGRVYKAGEVVKTNDPLDKMFKNKFERVLTKADFDEADASGDAKPKKRKRSRKSKIKLPDAPPEAEGEAGRGDDVTESFALAVEHDLKVYKRGSSYHVFDEGGVVALNEKALKASTVEEFISDHIEG